MKKICTKCGTEYPATAEYFHRSKDSKFGLRSDCKRCRIIATKQYQQTEKGKQNHRKACQKFRLQHPETDKQYYEKNKTQILAQQAQQRQTLIGHLKITFRNMRDRCNNPVNKRYDCYGGRGIQCLFQTFEDFYRYVTRDLGVVDFNQIKGLQIDRTNNNGHYQKGNIRFVTAKINSNNRRKPKHAIN